MLPGSPSWGPIGGDPRGTTAVSALVGVEWWASSRSGLHSRQLPDWLQLSPWLLLAQRPMCTLAHSRESHVRHLLSPVGSRDLGSVHLLLQLLCALSCSREFPHQHPLCPTGGLSQATCVFPSSRCMLQAALGRCLSSTDWPTESCSLPMGWEISGSTDWE